LKLLVTNYRSFTTRVSNRRTGPLKLNCSRQDFKGGHGCLGGWDVGGVREKHNS